MPLRPTLRADADLVQVAGAVPSRIRLPGDVIGTQRTVRLSPERIRHLGARRPEWLTFCLRHMPDVLADPDYLGQRAHGDPRRVEFVRLVGQPPRWLLVAVKFLDDRAEAWVNSAHPVAPAYLTRRLRTHTMTPVSEPRGRKGRRHHPQQGI